MDSEFLHEMLGLSVDHYIAVVAVEVGCHVVHAALKRSRGVAGKVRAKRARAREAKAKGGSDARAGPTHNAGRRYGGRACPTPETLRPANWRAFAFVPRAA